jgi:hypothetical protein
LNFQQNFRLKINNDLDETWEFFGLCDFREFICCWDEELGILELAWVARRMLIDQIFLKFLEVLGNLSLFV